VILDRILKKPGIKMDKILGEFTKKEIEGIYPALSPIMVQALTEELELMSYVTIREGKITVNAKGKKKLAEFKSGLSKEEIKALGI
jgi:hypothetical protein